jgi:serine/threonine protein phosphatase 1
LKRYVIGDVHGCAKALRSLLEVISPQADDELIFLGDYVDRGPSSKECVEILIDLSQRCRTVFLRGNHEIMLMGVLLSGLSSELWFTGGGFTTVASYGGSLKKIPRNHIEFFQSLKPYHETEREIFVHANYDPALPMSQQDDRLRYWTHLSVAFPLPHKSGKRVFVGHTPQINGEVLLFDHLVCVDTYCFGGGYLTGLNLDTEEILQFDRRGHERRSPRRLWTHRFHRFRAWIIRLTRKPNMDSISTPEP